MAENRRTFLKGSAALGATAAAGGVESAAAQTPTEAARGFAMPRGMVLLTMQRDGTYRLGVKTERGVLDVPAAGRALGMAAPADMDDLLQNGRGDALEAVVEAALARGGRDLFVPEGAVRYGPVVTRPEKIVMMGFNYRRHAAETGTPIPPNPVLFTKCNNALNHHGGTIKLPTGVASRFDYEVELVMVIGKEARDVPEETALEYVAGYCTGNDFTARDLQFLTSQYLIGKSCDGFAPLGPYLVTSDLVGDPNNLRLECRVNGERRQDWNTNDMIFNCRRLISFASRTMTLKPGDIYFTGTPQGVILGKPEDQRVWLKAGDKVACSLEKLGELRFDLV